MQNKATSTQENPVSPNQPTYDNAALWRQRYAVAVTNQRGMFKRFADWYDDFYAIVQQKNYTMWRSKIYIPILATKVWNLVAKFISLKPGFEVRPRIDNMSATDLDVPSDLEDNAYKAQLKLEYDYDNPKLDRPIREKLLSTLIDTSVTGTGLAKVNWDMCKDIKYSHPLRADGTIDMSKEEVRESVRGYNNLIPVNIFNVFIAPSSVDLYNAPWIIIKDFKTLSQLQAVNDGKGVEIYKNLDQLKDARSTGDEFAVYKKSRNRLTTQTDVITADQTVDFFAIYECYDKSTSEIITFAEAGNSSSKGDTWVEIRRLKNPYWHGKYPMVRFLVKPRPYDFWGQGVMETSQRLQRAANDVLNHYMDNWNLSVDGMLMAQESSGINDYIVEPGGLITYRTEEPKQFKFPEPNPAALNMVMEQIMQGIEQDTISNYATGAPNSDTDKTRGTKGGIMALQQAADDLTAFMRMNFQESVKTIGEMWMSNSRQFESRSMTVHVNRNNKKVPLTIAPEDLQYDHDLRVDEASMLPISDDQVKQEFAAFTQQILGFQQASVAQHQAFGTDPLIIDFTALVEESAEKNGFRNVQHFLGKAPKGPTPLQQQQQAQMQAAQAKQAKQTPQEKLIESMNYKDAPDDIKRQMEQQAGFQPSQMAQNSSDPHVKAANQQVLAMAHDLHAKGHIHPSVVDMVRGHMGMPPIGNPDATPIGEPPAPPQPAQQMAPQPGGNI